MGDSPASEAHSTKTVLNDLRFEECIFAVVEPPNSSCAEHLLNLFHSQDLKKWLSYSVKSQIPLSSFLLYALKNVFFWHLTAGVVGIKVVLWESCVSSSVFVAGNSCAGSKEGLQYHDQ